MKKKKTLSLLVALMAILLPSCDNIEKETPTMINIIKDVYTNKGMYSPGETVEVNVELYNQTDQNHDGDVILRLVHLDEEVLSSSGYHLSIKPGELQVVQLDFKAPEEDFTGYMLITEFKKQSYTVDSMTTAVDVSSDWSKFPRYGYLTDYGPKTAKKIEETFKTLTKYHLNGLQFYDWQNKHHMPLPYDTSGNPLASWKEIANRTVLYKTVSDYIDAAHAHGMVAMNYNLLYGAFDGSEKDGVNMDWGLYVDNQGKQIDSHTMPANWATPKILVMDPNNQDWQDYIIEQETKTMENLAFDGWHVDQLGSRGTRYNKKGQKVDLINGFVDLLTEAKERMDTRLIFNVVDGYGKAEIAEKINVDALYQEVWSDTTYANLKSIIDFGSVKTNYTKSTILAAYMNYGKRNSPGYFNLPSVLLTSATIFASGGSHLALGDSGMLSSEYFPSDNLKMSLQLQEKLRSYYSFMVAYENLLRDNTKNDVVQVEIDAAITSIMGNTNTIWNFAKSNDNYTMVHLINLLGNRNDWRDDDQKKVAPKLLNDFTVRLYTDKEFKSIKMASPDYNDGLLVNIEYKRTKDDKGVNCIELKLPYLEYWSMLVLEK
jgi:dextranase